MSPRWRIAAFVAALAFLVLTVVNASWLAPVPRGYLKLVAVQGAHQLAAPGANGPCPAAQIEPPLHDYLANTLGGLDGASRGGAQMVTVPLAATADGHLVLYPAEPLECRTNATGPIGALTLAQVAALDAGHGYTPDGGRTFPFRGRAVGLIPRVEEALRQLPTKPILFDLPLDRRAAAQLVATLRALGRDPVALGDGFRGAAPDLAIIRQAWPDAWLWDTAGAARCASDYRLQGWFGIIPPTCRHGTVVVPLSQQWSFAGWPNRMIDRMAATGTRIVVSGPPGPAGALRGLALPEQLGEVPDSFNGYLWVEDIATIGPALRPAYQRRTPREDADYAAAWERRRAAR